MNTARQAPEISIRPGGGLANIRHLRKLVDWYQRYLEHQHLIADTAKRQNNQFVVSTTTGSGLKNVVAHKGTRYDVIPPASGANYSDYELNSEVLVVSQPSTMAANTSSSLYNTPGTPPATDPPDRTPYTLPRPRGLVLLREVKDFILWATRSTDPAPAPTGLATRDDLLKAAQSIAAAGSLAGGR